MRQCLEASYVSMVLVIIVHVVSPFVKYWLSVVTVRVTLQPVRTEPAKIKPPTVKNTTLRIVLTVKSAAKLQKRLNIRKFRKKFAKVFVVF